MKSIKTLTVKLGLKKNSSDGNSGSDDDKKEKVPQVKVFVHDAPSKGSLFPNEKLESLSSSDSSSREAETKKIKPQQPSNTKKKITTTSTSSTSPTNVPHDPPKSTFKSQRSQTKNIEKEVKVQQSQAKKTEKDPPKQKVTKVSLSARPSLTLKQSMRNTNINATPMRSSKKSQSLSTAATTEIKTQTKPQVKSSLSTTLSSSKRVPPIQEKLQPKPAAKGIKTELSQKSVGTQSLRSKSSIAYKPHSLLSQSQSLTSKSAFFQQTQPEKNQKGAASPTVDERNTWEERERYLLKRLHEAEGLYAAQRNENIRLKMAYEDLKSITEKRLGDIKDRMTTQGEKYKQELLKYDSIVSNQASTIAELQRQFLKLYQTKLSSVVIRRETLDEDNGGGLENDDDFINDDEEYSREDNDRSGGYLGGPKSFNNFCPCHKDLITLEKLISQQSVDIKNLERRLEASERNHAQQKMRYEEEIERLKKGRGFSYTKSDGNIAKRLEAYKLPDLEVVCTKIMDALDRCLDGVPHHESMDALSSMDRDFVDKSPDEVIKSLKKIRDILQIIITHIQIF